MERMSVWPDHPKQSSSLAEPLGEQARIPGLSALCEMFRSYLGIPVGGNASVEKC